MAQDIAIGAAVERNGESLGSVETVQKDERTGELTAVLVRSARAENLIRIPARFLQVESGDHLTLLPTAELDSLERTAIESGRMPPTGSHLTDAGPTEPSATPEQILGRTPGMPSEYDGPSTS